MTTSAPTGSTGSTGSTGTTATAATSQTAATAATAATSADSAHHTPAGRPTMVLLAGALVLLVIPSWIAIGLLIASVGLAVVWIGLGLWLLVMGFLDRLCNGFRGIAARILGEPIVAGYRTADAPGALARLRTILTDPARWRDVAYLFFAVSLGFGMALSSLIAFLIFPLGYWLSPLLLRLWAMMTRTIIGPSGEVELQERIGRLEETRSESLDHSAAELRRIERDLHDGAQAQLVALGMHLGLAEELIKSDPAAAVQMIADARVTSQAALAELRSLVRGIHPPVLADRGLAGAIEALALAHPRPVELDIDLAGRLPDPIESAVYFAVAEALTNVAKHANAHHVVIAVRHDGTWLTVRVRDDGVGGARISTGGGLAGIRQRLAAFDGALAVSSPAGGPTEVVITVPSEVTAVTQSH